MKILCYVYKYVDNTIKDEILELISNTSEYRDRIKNTYELKSAKEDGLKYCFLQYIDDLDNKEKAIPIEWYSNFNDNIDILLNIKNNHLPVYSSDLVDINNIFTYNTDYFKPNGELNMRKIITNGDEETKEGEIEILEEIDPDNLFDLELGSDELRKLSELLKDDDEYKFPTPLSIRSNKSSLNSTSGTELYKRMKELLDESKRLGIGSISDSGNGSNNQHLDDFIIEFSGNITKLRKIEFGDALSKYSEEHYNIFNSLFQSLLKRKKYALSYVKNYIIILSFFIQK